MTCKCDQIGGRVREGLAENYDATEPWELAAVRADGRERLYHCGACGAWFFMGRPLGARPGEQEIVYFRLPDAAPEDFATLDTRPALRRYYRDLLALEMAVEDEGQCSLSSCDEPAVRGKAFCPEHVFAARAGELG